MPFVSFAAFRRKQKFPATDTCFMDKWHYMLTVSTGAFAAIVLTGGEAMIYFENLVAKIPF